MDTIRLETSNMTLEVTATRRESALKMIRTLPPRATLARGGGTSALYR